MGILTCLINPLWEKQLIKNEYTQEEHWIEYLEIPNILYNISKKNDIKGVWLEGPYSDCNDIVNKYKKLYPESFIPFTIN